MYRLNLHDYVKLFSSYTELRAQENRVVRIAFVKGNNTANSRSATSGISARVYKNGSWGFASNPEISEAAAKAVIQAATENAVFLDSKNKREEVRSPNHLLQVRTISQLRNHAWGKGNWLTLRGNSMTT